MWSVLICIRARHMSNWKVGLISINQQVFGSGVNTWHSYIYFTEEDSHYIMLVVET